MYPIIERDSALRPFEKDIKLRMDNYWRTRRALVGEGRLSDFANAHEYYGFHHTDSGWVYREWAPMSTMAFTTRTAAGSTASGPRGRTRCI